MPELFTPPRHIAVVNHSTLADDRDVAFWTAATDRYLREHVCPRWDVAPPGVFFYGSASAIPANQAAVIGIVDDDGNADSAGYHAKIGELIFSLVDMRQSANPCRTLMHEAAELTIDPDLNRKTPGPGGLLYYLEDVDATQRDDYEIEVTILGETRRVTAANFITPAWFGLEPDGPYDHLELIKAPFEIRPGGYAIVEDSDGIVDFLGELNLDEKTRLSRTKRIFGSAVLWGPQLSKLWP